MKKKIIINKINKKLNKKILNKNKLLKNNKNNNFIIFQFKQIKCLKFVNNENSFHNLKIYLN